MANITITVQNNFGTTNTYSQDFDHDILVEDFFETCLAAYDSNGYMNDIDITVGSLFGGDTKLSWDKHNYIQIENPFEEKVESILETLTALNEVQGLYDQDNWYMGHRY